jgi:hypothetical protein
MPRQGSAKLRAGRDLDEYCRLWLREIAEENIATLLNAVQARIDTFLEEISLCCRQLRALCDRFRPAMESGQTRTLSRAGLAASAGKTTQTPGAASNTDASTLPGLVSHFDRSFQPGDLQKLGWFQTAAADASDPFRRVTQDSRPSPDQLAKDLLVRARNQIQGMVKEADTARSFIRTHGGPESARSVLLKRAEAAQPRLSVSGSRQHLIVALPEGPSGDALNEMLASTMIGTEGSFVRWDEDVLLCCETADCSLSEVTRAVLGSEDVSTELVRSVMTRLDVIPGMDEAPIQGK